MFKMLIDTCVWLDLAKDPRQAPLLSVVEEMVKIGMVTLIMPRLVLDEFRRMRIGIEEGAIKVVDKETYPRPAGAQETIQRDVLKGAKKAARNVERRYGKKNLGPWDDFEWGMINGKLSALRWILGDEWDMLDT